MLLEVHWLDGPHKGMTPAFDPNGNVKESQATAKFLYMTSEIAKQKGVGMLSPAAMAGEPGADPTFHEYEIEERIKEGDKLILKARYKGPRQGN